MVLKTTPQKENTLACQSDGIQPPTVEPTITPIQMAFLFIDSPRCGCQRRAMNPTRSASRMALHARRSD